MYLSIMWRGILDEVFDELDGNLEASQIAMDIKLLRLNR